MGIECWENTIPEMIKVIFRLKNLRRADGVAGKLVGFTASQYGTDSLLYLDATGNVTPWPGAMTLVVRDMRRCNCAGVVLIFACLQYDD